jgi:hypothetical protein
MPGWNRSAVLVGEVAGGEVATGGDRSPTAGPVSQVRKTRRCAARLAGWPACLEDCGAMAVMS